MLIASWGFVALVAAGLVAWSAASTPQARVVAWLLVSLVFVGTQGHGSPAALWPVLAFVLASYLAILSQSGSNPRLPLWAANALLVLLFVYLKRYAFLPALPFPAIAVTVGLSYIFFKAIHVAVDVRQGDIKPAPRLSTFLAYSLSMLTFLSGPIQRFQDFERDVAAPLPLDADRTRKAVSRIVSGLFKIMVIAPILDSVQLQYAGALGAAGGSGAVKFAAACGVYPAFLFFNFAGYMDVVIGVGVLFGMRIPENFDRPWTADSLLDIWNHWHITLSDWFRDYVFNPLSKSLTYRFPGTGNANWIGSVGFFVTFLLMGVWHGSSATFVVYGLILGFGAAAARLYQVAGRAMLGRPAIARLHSRAWYIGLCRAMTLTYFSFALVCVWAPGSAFDVFHRVGWRNVAAGLVLLTVLWTIAHWLAAAAVALWSRFGPAWRPAAMSPGREQVWLAAKLFALVLLQVERSGGSTVFIYQAF